MCTVAWVVIGLLILSSICSAPSTLDSSLQAALERVARLAEDDAAADHYLASNQPLQFDDSYHPVSTYPVAEQNPSWNFDDMTSQHPVFFRSSEHEHPFTQPFPPVTPDVQMMPGLQRLGGISTHSSARYGPSASTSNSDFDRREPFLQHEEPLVSSVQHLSPPPMTDQERIDILKRLGSHFTMRVYPQTESTLLPYKGEQLTLGLIKEAYGSSWTRLRQFEPTIFCCLLQILISQRSTPSRKGRWRYSYTKSIIYTSGNG